MIRPPALDTPLEPVNWARGRRYPVAGYDEEASHPEHRHRADRGAGSVAPFHRQADEGERALAQERLEIAQALDVGDVEFAAGLVDQQVHLALRPRPHRVD